MPLSPWPRGYFGWISGWIGSASNAGFMQPWANSVSISTAKKVPFPALPRFLTKDNNQGRGLENGC